MRCSIDIAAVLIIGMFGGGESERRMLWYTFSATELFLSNYSVNIAQNWMVDSAF
jgi:hypothetical protein